MYMISIYKLHLFILYIYIYICIFLFPPLKLTFQMNQPPTIWCWALHPEESRCFPRQSRSAVQFLRAESWHDTTNPPQKKHDFWHGKSCNNHHLDVFETLKIMGIFTISTGPPDFWTINRIFMEKFPQIHHTFAIFPVVWSLAIWVAFDDTCISLQKTQFSSSFLVWLVHCNMKLSWRQPRNVEGDVTCWQVNLYSYQDIELHSERRAASCAPDEERSTETAKPNRNSGRKR